MKKSDLAGRLAEGTRVTPAAAADQIDRVVHNILKKLRSGRSACLPGLGTFTPGRLLDFQFQTQKPAPRGRGTRKGKEV